MRLTFKSSLTNLCEVNNSFDTGILRVAYTNDNRNGSFIAKETFERCIKTIFNCPVVCHYMRDTDSIGGHDIEFVTDDDGNVTIVNATMPVGVVPESAKYYWETLTEENGQVHEYLCIEVLIWKRQEAYRKIKEDGIVSHSMEITVNRGHMADGLFVIEDFVFTALCLLGDGVEPCFEQAALELFSMDKFKRQMEDMMSDLREEYTKVDTQERVDIDFSKNMTEGGEKQLEQKMELLSKYGLTAEQVEFDLESMTQEELEMKLSELYGNHNGEPDAGGAEGDDAGGEPGTEGQFALSGEQFREELLTALSAVKFISCWGEEINRYMYCDYDTEANEVYCYDLEDWNLYGFSYSMNGDHVVIDFDSKTRKKFSIVDFDEGEVDFSYKGMFETAMRMSADKKSAELTEQFNKEKAELEEKYNAASGTITELNNEISELRQYQQNKLAEERSAEEDAVFAAFEDLSGVEAFEKLRESCAEMTIDEIEEKCYAIRGRNTQTFSAQKTTKTPRLPIETRQTEVNEPYGGLFVEFPPTKY